MEHVTEKEFEFKPAYNVAKFFGDFVLSFNVEFGDDLDKTLSGYLKGGNKVSPVIFDFLKQLQMILDCKGKGQLSYHNTMFNLTKFNDIFVFSFKRDLASDLDQLFRDILSDQEVPQVVYSFVRKFQDWINLKSADKEHCNNCQGRGFTIKNRGVPTASREWNTQSLYG